MRKFVLLIIFILMVAMNLPQAALANEAENNGYPPDTGGYKINGRIYDTLKKIGVPIPSKIEAIRVPGTCLILEQKWCDEMQKLGSHDSARILFSSLPVGTPVFAPMDGFISNNQYEFIDGMLPRSNMLVFSDKLDERGRRNHLTSEEFYFYAFGIGLFHDLNNRALRIIEINKGDVLFKITEDTYLPSYGEGFDNIVLSTFHYKKTNRGWVNVTFGPPFE